MSLLTCRPVTANKANWWTAAELFLGIVCPCLVTFRPIIKSGYMIFSRSLSRKYQDRLSRFTGIDGTSPDRMKSVGIHDVGIGRKESPSDSNTTNRKDPFDVTPSLRSKKSDLEAQAYPMDEKPQHKHPVPPLANGVPAAAPAQQQHPYQGIGQRDRNGMAVDQEAALAALDPRPKDVHLSDGQRESLGTTTEVNHPGRHEAGTPPEEGIKVNRGYALEESRGIAR